MSDAVDAIFAEVLTPIAGRVGGAAPFPLGPDPKLETYYVDRPKRAMTRDDFTAASCVGFDDFERRLAAHWRSAGRPELAASAGRFGAAARAAYALGEDDAEVSPFIYVMF